MKLTIGQNRSVFKCESCRVWNITRPQCGTVTKLLQTLKRKTGPKYRFHPGFKFYYMTIPKLRNF